jgi:hypothetical protein
MTELNIAAQYGAGDFKGVARLLLSCSAFVKGVITLGGHSQDKLPIRDHGLNICVPVKYSELSL